MKSSKRFNTVVLLAAVALTLVGCSSSATTDQTNEPPKGATTEPTVEPSTGATVTTVMVTETEFAIELSEETFTPGTYTFEVANEGGTTHDLKISGPGVDASTSMLSEGGSDSFTVALQQGTYELWCSVGSHRLQGMDLTITVA